jgi:type IV fimbrial biogenesis protein FimT
VPAKIAMTQRHWTGQAAEQSRGPAPKAAVKRMPGRRAPSSEPGFTLVELMVTLTVVAILLVIAVPSLNNATLSGKLTAYANSLVGSAHLARSEAIKRNALVTLCAASNGTSCGGNWEQGWIVLSAGTVFQRQEALPSGFKVTSNPTSGSIGFQPTGVGTTGATTLKLCRATPSVGPQEREVTIESTGRTSVKTTTGGSCP